MSEAAVGGPRMRAVTVDVAASGPLRIALESALIALGAWTVSSSEGPRGARIEADFGPETTAAGEVPTLGSAVLRAAQALGVADAQVQVQALDEPRVPALWQRRLAPSRIGPLAIVAVDDRASPTPGVHTIRIEPGMAFGTVGHVTTTLCLEWLVALAALPDRVLDVGTGTGVLALAALALGARQVIGVDVDPEARAVAAENARLNGVAERFRVESGDVASVGGAFPLVLANILTEPLVAMAPALAAATAPGGTLVLSGVRVGEEAELAGAYAAHGLAVSEHHARDGWVALVLRR